MKIEISRAIVRQYLRLDQELTVVLSYGGPAALPNCYRWRTPMRAYWARLECPELGIDEEREGTCEIPKRPYGRLGRAFEGYAGCFLLGPALVRTRYRNGRNDPVTQHAAMALLKSILIAKFEETELGQLQTPVRRAA